MSQGWRGRAMRVGGTLLAVALLVLAVWFAARGVDLTALRAADPADVALLAGLVAVNLVVTAGVFWLITLSFDARPRPGFVLMLELIGASALLNYIPGLPGVRPGLWGRAAYLKARHGLPVAQSVMIVGVVLALAVVGAAATLVLLWPGSEAGPGWRWAVLAGVVAALSAAAPAAGRLVLRRPLIAAWLWLPLRMLDLLAAAGRLWLAFRIVGQPIGLDAAVLAGAAGLLVKLAGVTPNGLGLSEWVVAVLAGALEPVSAATGAAAALVDRAAEVGVVVIVGLIAAARLRQRLRRGDGAPLPPADSLREPGMGAGGGPG